VAGYELTIISAGGVSRQPLPSAGQLTIGRDAGAEVRLAGTQVSRHHARLRVDGGRFTIEDLGSTNGTVLHHARLTARKPVPVAPGDAIHVGDFVLIVAARYVGDEVDGGPDPSLFDLPDDVVVEAPAMRALYAELGQVARSDINVLILGETGVGKDVVARCLHQLSPRRERPFLRLNCAALTGSLLESELFGHERGAFTGAVAAKAGLLETADGGSVFLDEIGEFPPALQPKLLQVLETHEVLRVGGVSQRAIDVRFVAATNRDLEADVAAGRFRRDLFYRLSAFTVDVPPLRERAEDVVPLATAMSRRAADRAGLVPAPALDASATAALVAYPWPGNVRELRNVVERALVVSKGGPITAVHLRLNGTPPAGAERGPVEPVRGLALTREEAAERQRIIDVLVRCSGNQSSAARMLGVSRGTLLHRLDAYRISRPRKRPGVPT